MEKKKNSKKDDKEGLLKKAENVRKENVREKSGKKSLLARVILRISSIIAIFILAFLVFWLLTLKFGNFVEVKKESKSALVDKQLSFCQELVTAKYRYSDIITIKKAAGFSKSYSIIKYTGLIRVGIADFTDLYYELSTNEKVVTFKMPECEVLGNDIVRQEVFDEKQSIFVPITTQEVFDEIDIARQIAQEDMLAEGILKDSAEYAKKIIRQFMIAAGFEDVIFE
ncbi:MAG: DUF4230 domain-containing protein [Treponema sp.]|nr:DUF4230 domain-containing protein [Treponema sp.]